MTTCIQDQIKNHMSFLAQEFQKADGKRYKYDAPLVYRPDFFHPPVIQGEDVAIYIFYHKTTKQVLKGSSGIYVGGKRLNPLMQQ